MVRLIVFVILSLGIVRFSWPSLRDPRSHGFFRFFAFEFLLGLILLNLGHWFRHPFSPLQILSWILLTSSALLAAHGFCLLRRVGRPSGSFEDTTVLVTQGAYRYIRHPLYASLLFLGWGAFCKDPSLLSSTVVLVASAFLFATARAEEAENLSRFGPGYADYMKTTRMFIPFLF